MDAQPMKTAPKDGTVVVATWPDGTETRSCWEEPKPWYRPHWTKDGEPTEDDPVSWRAA